MHDVLDSPAAIHRWIMHTPDGLALCVYSRVISSDGYTVILYGEWHTKALRYRYRAGF